MSREQGLGQEPFSNAVRLKPGQRRWHFPGSGYRYAANCEIASSRQVKIKVELAPRWGVKAYRRWHLTLPPAFSSPFGVADHSRLSADGDLKPWAIISSKSTCVHAR